MADHQPCVSSPLKAPKVVLMLRDLHNVAYFHVNSVTKQRYLRMLLYLVHAQDTKRKCLHVSLIIRKNEKKNAFNNFR